MAAENKTTSLLIVEEHDLIRQGLESVLKDEAEFDVVDSIADPERAADKISDLQPQIVVLGLDAREDGADFCSALSDSDPEVKILLLAPPGCERLVVDAFKKGASGCLLTDVMAEDLVQTIKMLAKGQMVVSQAMAGKGLVERRSKRRNIPNLSIRELEVIQLMADGLRNKEIAEELCLSEVTVKTHVSRILRKLGKTNRTAAVLHAHRQGWVTLRS
ncbi:MAG: response regulator transcription factor [Actinomycetota bacterium]|nr:response regulator transcription factor [Actinomycetota bacterium]